MSDPGEIIRRAIASHKHSVVGDAVEDRILLALRRAGYHLHRWQDISEAPKDGTKILAYTVHGDYELPHWYVIEDWDFEPVGDGLFRKVMRKPTEGWNGNMPVKFCHLPPAPPEPGR